jgi:dimethylglycine dehydrogenase
VVPANQERTLLFELLDAGRRLGLRLIGTRAMNSLRLEKGYGTWSTEFRQGYTAAMSGLDRFIDFDKGEFLGREAAAKERESGPARRLVLLEIDADDADAATDDPVWLGARRVGFVTSGGYGHRVQRSLALAYLDRAVIGTERQLVVSVVGDRKPARVLARPPYDPGGSKLRRPVAPSIATATPQRR